MNDATQPPATGEAAHTPTPWNLHRCYDGAIVAVERSDVGKEPFTDGSFVIARGDKVIGTIQFRAGKDIGWEHVSNPEEYRANAELVLLAVNSHARLTAENKALRAALMSIKARSFPGCVEIIEKVLATYNNTYTESTQ